jgi:hypothetical protein
MECAICLEPVEYLPYISPCCKQQFHRVCIHRAEYDTRKTNCPTCTLELPHKHQYFGKLRTDCYRDCTAWHSYRTLTYTLHENDTNEHLWDYTASLLKMPVDCIRAIASKDKRYMPDTGKLIVGKEETLFITLRMPCKDCKNRKH